MAQKKRTSKRKKSSRSKIYIPLNSVLSLCAIIVGVCTALLLATTFADRKSSSVPMQKPAAVQKNQDVQKKQESAKPKSLPESAPVAVKPEKASKTVAETKESSINKPESGVNSALKIDTDEKKSGWDIPAFPAAKNKAKIAIVFDDGGHNMSQLEKCVTLPFPVTVAVLPQLTHSAEAASRVRSSGNEVILHQPMQSVNLSVNPGAGAVTPSMTEDEIRAVVLANIYEIWPIAGMNNHEGSLITADAEKIGLIMQLCSQQEIYFLDSRTNSKSQVSYVSSVMGYPYYERNVFLDNTKNRADILKEIEKGVDIANKNGVVIMIGHVWSADILPGILREVYPVLNAKGYVFTTVSQSGAMKRG